MRWQPMLVLVVVAACSQKKPAPASSSGSAGAGSGSGTTAAAPADARAVDAGSAAAAAFCAVEDGMAQLTAFTADARSATFCVSGQDTTGCATVDLATGAVRAAATPPAKPEPYEIKQDAKTAQLCKAGACVTLALPAPPDHGYRIAVNADGTRAVALGDDREGLTVLDGQTGKKLAHIKTGDADHPCTEAPHFASDRIYVATYDCNGPGGPGFLYALDGKRVGTVESIDATSSIPLLVEGSQFAFASRGGSGYEIVDVKTGRSIRHADFARPEDCDDKHDCFLLGEGMSWIANPLVRTTEGKLVVLGSQTIRVVDLASGTVERSWRIPACPPKPEAT